MSSDSKKRITNRGANEEDDEVSAIITEETMAGEKSTMKPGDILNFFVKAWPYLKLLFKQLQSYESRVRQLETNVNKLRKEEKIVQNKVREAEKRHGRAVDDDVNNWLQEVKKVISQYENFCKDEDSSYAVFSDGYLPKPAVRYRLSVAVVHITKEVNKLLKNAQRDVFSYWRGPPSFDADFDNIRYESLPSRNQTMGDIVNALADSNVRVIGVHGWSGVGKTSLIKEVAKKVRGKMFDEVIMVNVTSSPDIRSIQGQIADRLGMKLEEESESGRAARIRDRLKNPKEKTLIILDDMRVKLDFNVLGIPLLDNNDGSQINPSTHHNYLMKTQVFGTSSLVKVAEPLARDKGCKILMVSDSEQLLLSQMNGKGIQRFHVEALTEEEAVMLFESMAEVGDGNSELKKLASKIAKNCKGLPVTIVTTANALKKKDLRVWEVTNQKLERQNLMAATPGFSTMLSYELLEDDELKSTFLVCASMGHDALITDLVRYCIGLGFLQGIHTVREAKDKVHVMVGKLKELSLLADSFSSDRFTMQDIIRDMAFSIASQQMHAFTLTKGKLDEWPDQDKLESYTAISLHHCDMTDIMKEFPESINCSRLRVFHLDSKDTLLEIPDYFFNGMKELRVLKLIGIHLPSLPSSIKCLKKLRMLCLERCKLREHLSVIGELKKLRVLSLSGSDIDSFPVQLRLLAKLQILDISNCFRLKEIPAHVLSSLTSLEELYVGNSPIEWKDEEGQGNQSQNASLSELKRLNQLTTLDMQIPKINYLPKNLSFYKLESYKIVISEYFNPYPMWDLNKREMPEASRYLALQLENGFNIHPQKEIKILFDRVENLLLGQLNDVEDIFYELNYEGFPYLKYLSIVSNSKVKSIINSKNKKHPEKAFPKLETLFLYAVTNIENICQSQITSDSFRKLKTIKLKICGQLKNVFFSSMIENFSKLETIEVSECNSLKEIVTLEMQNIQDQIKFPELRSLTLQSLSEFIGFYANCATTGEQVPNRWPGVLFDEKVVISKLERMELSLIKIQEVWNDHPLTRSYFRNLIHLDVNDCWNLKYLLSLSMSKSLLNLQSLFVSECGMMQRIFKEPEVGMVENEITLQISRLMFTRHEDFQLTKEVIKLFSFPLEPFSWPREIPSPRITLLLYHQLLTVFVES
ncbi:hypothetical protein Fmac_011815 [Flemingia macrophylla]|uniref:AAA+ ATPase domain-containing protein n=1 Tax=Flemingia macrophylla TaxID=520843 RepID=A0ABD1MNK8_9FABA